MYPTGNSNCLLTRRRWNAPKASKEHAAENAASAMSTECEEPEMTP